MPNDSQTPLASILENNRPAALYYILYMIVMTFILLQLFVGFVIVTFQEVGVKTFRETKLNRNQVGGAKGLGVGAVGVVRGKALGARNQVGGLGFVVKIHLNGNLVGGWVGLGVGAVGVVRGKALGAFREQEPGG